MPSLAPNNLLVWEIYRTLTGPFCQRIDFFALMARWGVRHPVRLLQKLNKISKIAWENVKRLNQPDA
jgi:hypothetical protein